MLVVLERYKAFLIILTAVALAILLWLLISTHDGSKTPSRGVFVLTRMVGSAQGGDV